MWREQQFCAILKYEYMFEDRGLEIHDRRIQRLRKIPAKEAVCEAYPESLKDELRDYLKENGYQQLYSHQVEMFKTAEAGKNVVITTSTASGKTLAFLLPVLQEILENPLARAIFVYPTKALASDQYRAGD